MEVVEHSARESQLLFSRYTQISLLRLLTNSSVMGEQTQTIRNAWAIYDRWLEDPRVEFYPEPRNLDVAFRESTQPFARKPASKAIGDCFLLAYAKEVQATLITFDRGLQELARRLNYPAIVPAQG